MIKPEIKLGAAVRLRVHSGEIIEGCVVYLREEKSVPMVLVLIGVEKTQIGELLRDLSPWWFWPTGIIAMFVLMITAGNLLRLADKNE